MNILAVVTILVCIGAKKCEGMVWSMKSRENVELIGGPIGNLLLRADKLVRHTLARCDLLLAAHSFSPVLSLRLK